MTTSLKLAATSAALLALLAAAATAQVPGTIIPGSPADRSHPTIIPGSPADRSHPLYIPGSPARPYPSNEAQEVLERCYRSWYAATKKSRLFWNEACRRNLSSGRLKP